MHTLYTQSLSIVFTRLLLSYILDLNAHTIYSVSQSQYILSVSVSETGCQSSVTALVIGRWTRHRPSPARARTFLLQHMTAAQTMKGLSQAT